MELRGCIRSAMSGCRADRTSSAADQLAPTDHSSFVEPVGSLPGMDRDSLSEPERHAAYRMQHPDEALEREWLYQNNLIYGALIGVAVVMVQPFLVASSLDLAATICVIAFSIAIPLLAALILVNRQETFRGRRTSSKLVTFGQVVAHGAAFTGLVAAFWHIN
jgi:hypothetical protein